MSAGLNFATPDEAVAAVNAAFGPVGNVFWRFDPQRPLRLLRKQEGATASVKTFHVATMQTMHFGWVTIDLATGDTRFIDEDRHDGNDFEIKRVTLPADWLAALRAVPWPQAVPAG